MKKAIFIAALAFTFAACGSGESTTIETTTDSTAVDSSAVDSTKKTDSTVTDDEFKHEL